MFNVLTDGWIRATAKDGSSKEYGIRELLLNAHDLLGITDDSPLIEYGLYRFLFVFLMDAYQPETVFDIRKLIRRGEFDGEVIDRYIELCEKEGVSFDLFDKRNPFLQESVEEKNNKKSVAALNPIVPTGTSRIFFDHGIEKTRSFTKPEIARALLSTTLFPRGGSGYRACISGEGLIFNILAGDNLFETLSYGMVAKKDSSLIYGRPYWREKGYESKDVRVETSLLFGLTFPIRQVALLDEATSSKTIHFAPGLTPNVSFWRDPFVAYYQGKDKMYPLRASQDVSTCALKGQWRNIATIAQKNDGIQILKNVADREKVRLISYAVLVNNAIQDIQRSEFLLPVDVYSDEEKHEQVQEAITKCEDVASCLRGKMRAAMNIRGTRIADSVIRDYLFRYYASCESLFTEQITGEVDIDGWINKVGDIALADYNDFLDKFCVTAGRIEEAIIQRNKLFSQLRKLGWQRGHRSLG